MRIEPRPAVLNGHSEIATVAHVTPELAATLSLPLNAGVVISHRMWKSDLGGNENAVGSPIRVDEADLRVQGVAPDKLDGLYSDQSVDLWMPAAEENVEGGPGARRELWVVAQLREGASIHQAQTTIGSVFGGRKDVSVAPFTGIAPNMARGLSRVGMFLTFSAAAVFFIACINVASFLLGRALRRSHETSLRVALGATRAELFWDLFADSVVIAVTGGVVGVLLGTLTARALPAVLFESDAESLSFSPHLLPIFLAALVCVAITVVCGMMPVAGTITDRPWMVLQRETGSPSRAILRLRSALVVLQITVCCMLLICTAVLRAGLHSALDTGAGKRLGNPILLTVQALPMGGPEIDAGYFDEVEKKARSGFLVPVGWTARLPGNQPTWRNFRLQQPSVQSRNVAMDVSWLTPASIQSLERLPVAGRMFGLNDQRHKVAVVNEEAAAALFGKQTAGMVIRDAADLPIEIIGVVKKAGIHGPNQEENGGSATQKSRPTIYYGYLNQADEPSTIRDAPFRVPLTRPAASIELNANVVSASYFSGLGMPLVVGQRFSEDRISERGRVAVINQEAADLYFNGKAIGSGIIDDGGVRTEIIGVVRSQTFGTFEQHAEPTIYFLLGQDCPARMTLMLKASKWNSEMSTELRRKVESVPRGSSGSIAITTLNKQLEQSGLAPLRIAMVIGAVSAVVALVLGILGLLNAQSDAERQRQRDRAVRIALGAQRWRIVLLVVRTAGRHACLGAAIGILLSFAFVRLLIADVANVAAPSMQIWLIAPLLPVAAVMVASLIPARRASVIAPAKIMRDM